MEENIETLEDKELSEEDWKWITEWMELKDKKSKLEAQARKIRKKIEIEFLPILFPLLDGKQYIKLPSGKFLVKSVLSRSVKAYSYEKPQLEIKDKKPNFKF